MSSSGEKRYDVPSLISVLVPFWNEADFIAACLDSLLASDYPAERLEILVVDGMSDDGTRAILAQYRVLDSRLRVLDNPRRITPSALNIGIRAANGSIIVRVDAHACFPPDYISKLAEAIEYYDADNVGGVLRIKPRKPGLLGDAISISLAHPFGVGIAKHKTGGSVPRQVDTVPFGCYRREVFDRIGLFDENLARSQDMEFNIRLTHAGGTILLVPSLELTYYARSGLLESTSYNFNNGVWATYPIAFGCVAVGWRHLVPLAFVSTLVVLASVRLAAFAAGMGLYGVAVGAASVHVAASAANWRLAFVLPAVFASLHFGYGLGSAFGLFKVACSGTFWRRGLWKLLQSYSAIGEPPA